MNRNAAVERGMRQDGGSESGSATAATPDSPPDRREAAERAAAVEAQARRARAASRQLAALDGAARHRALVAMARRLRYRARDILAANALDVAHAETRGTAGAMLDRLRLDPGRLEAMARAVEEVAELPDPVGEVTEERIRPNGLRVTRVRIPLGVVAMIYESRPNVTSDAAALCFKAGNAVILRGGSESARSNGAITAALREGLEVVGAPVDAVQQVAWLDRAAIPVLLAQEDHVDLVIPRGGEGLIRAVSEVSRIPVLKHYKGVCHVYVDEGADPQMASEIVLNAKAQRPGVCNALETLLVHEAAAPEVLPRVAERLGGAGVELRGCSRTRELLGEGVLPATEEDWAAEYLDLILAVRVVEGLEAATDHIARWGSNHTEAIVTPCESRARAFIAAVGSSTVLVNASTRFADGGELGLGAEIGISTSRLHAFGPMGARELTTTRFEVWGEGQVRG